jgi:hypothetical protein
MRCSLPCTLCTIRCGLPWMSSSTYRHNFPTTRHLNGTAMVHGISTSTACLQASCGLRQATPPENTHLPQPLQRVQPLACAQRLGACTPQQTLPRRSLMAFRKHTSCVGCCCTSKVPTCCPTSMHLQQISTTRRRTGRQHPPQSGQQAAQARRPEHLCLEQTTWTLPAADRPTGVSSR